MDFDQLENLVTGSSMFETCMNLLRKPFTVFCHGKEVYCRQIDVNTYMTPRGLYNIVEVESFDLI